MRRDNSLIGSLGEKFFPEDAPWQRRKKLRLLLLAMAVGLVIGSLIIVVTWLQNRPR